MIEWLIYFSLDPIFRKQIVEWRSAKNLAGRITSLWKLQTFTRSDQLDLRQQKTEPALKLPMFWICFWKYLCFENTYVLKQAMFWKPQRLKNLNTPKKSPSVLIQTEILTSFPSSQTNFSTVCNFKVSNCCPSWFRRSWNEKWNGRRHVLVGGFNLSEKY